MHHLIYPIQDTFVTNRTGYETKNFGVDEILEVGTGNATIRYLNTTKTEEFVGNVVSLPLINYTGVVSGSMFTLPSGSGVSGSVNTSFQNANISIISAYVSGSITFDQYNTTTVSKKLINRSLLKFDINSISMSIASGNIVNPQFFLRMEASRETELPVTYTIYAYPISQSWSPGIGYFYDNVSTDGASWYYRDYEGGTPWDNTGSLILNVDYINTQSSATASFANGGGAWYTSSALSSSQTFIHQWSDINIDLTKMAYAWISGSIPNEGVILLSSEEVSQFPIYGDLKFFSRDTNTIYSPCLEVKWDDSVFITGSVYTGSTITFLSTGSINGYITSGSINNISGSNMSGSFVTGSISGSIFGTVTVNGDNVIGQLSGSSISGVFINGAWYGSTFNGEFSGASSTSNWNIMYPITSSSLSPLDCNRPMSVVVKNLKKQYKTGDIVRINVFGREQFPLKNFNKQTQQDAYLIPKYLPPTTYYSIKDNESEEILINFDNYTKVSCDGTGGYFILDTTGLPQERYLRVLVRTEYSSSINTYDNNDIFKIVR